MRPAFLLLASVLALAGCTTPTGTTDGATTTTQATASTPGTTTSPSPVTTTPTPTTTPVATLQVAIRNFAFSPATISVPVGATVTWTNEDETAHTVTLDDGSHDSGRLAAAATHAKAFEVAGSYSYHCEIHSSMKGTVIVTSGTPIPPPETTTKPTTPEQPSEIKIVIQGSTFSPSSLTVKKGTTIVWNNSDNVPHTVTTQASVFDSGPLDPGDEFTWVATKLDAVDQAIVSYTCKIHPNMRGQITVTN